MGQKPLPRGSLQICDRTGKERRIVPELPQAAVAVEAQYLACPTGAMIVINVFRVVGATDGAAAPLGRRQLVELFSPDAVSASEVCTLVRANGSSGFTKSQSGHHFDPSGTGTYGTPRRTGAGCAEGRASHPIPRAGHSTHWPPFCT
jgi:hypothetical protein